VRLVSNKDVAAEEKHPIYNIGCFYVDKCKISTLLDRVLIVVYSGCIEKKICKNYGIK